MLYDFINGSLRSDRAKDIIPQIRLLLDIAKQRKIPELVVRLNPKPDRYNTLKLLSCKYFISFPQKMRTCIILRLVF